MEQENHRIGRVRGLWRAVRARWWSSLAVDLVIGLLLFLAVMAWQERGLLSDAVPAPLFELTALDGDTHRLTDAEGKEVLLYFFAPWCGVCHRSIDNVEAVRQAHRADELAVYVIALDWSARSEVEAFVARHQLSVPILLGSPQTLRDYRVSAFPTYYVLDGRGRVRARSVGYSTELGLRLRL